MMAIVAKRNGKHTIWGDHTVHSTIAVGQVGGNGQFSLLMGAHSQHALFHTRNHSALKSFKQLGSVGSEMIHNDLKSSSLV